ncbi:methyl-accepting chemotaxis protein [Anaeromicropila herbilytica]|uniref:Chemotaxis protein n=1 Tax=Anaeromicropila herbilytica TaxID=2785025 RepID=A0A7R7EP68_9FIRM|nr:methyl-accepting chemotaxis protein [Anaeromicropila herbilytica]BCN32427.1 chemotaxis protein [Anaeromicropila herbilytica]
MKKTKAKSKGFNLHTIKAKVTLLCTFFILIAVLVNFLFVINITSNTITKNTQSTLLDLVKTSDTNLTSTLDKLSQSANFMMRSNAIQDFITSNGKDKGDDIADTITNYLSMNSSTETVSILNTDGKVLASSDESMVGNDLSTQTYFTKMIKSKQTTSGDASISKTSGDACVTFAIPIYERAMEEGQDAANTDASTTNSDTKDSTTSSQTSTGDPMDSSNQTVIGAVVAYVKASNFTSSLSEVALSNIDSSYAYLVDSKGTVIYHPNEKKIGTSISNSAIKKLVANINDSKTKSSGIISYTYDGSEKMASYSITDNNWILVISADRSDVLSSVHSMVLVCSMISIAIIVILGIIAYLFTTRITKPIKQITQYIHKTSELDFTEDANLLSLEKSKDETGEMAAALGQMRTTIHEMINQIAKASTDINNNANQLNAITNSVNDHASDNSSTAEELAAGMEETAATTEMIHDNIVQVRNNTKSINDKAANGANLSKELINRAVSLKETTKQASSETTGIYQEIKTNTDNAIEQAKAVEKINLLTQTIMDIADQTSLLALNATIEAARAGESGRGFAVVASEIGSLADQSAQTVANISSIVNEVHMAVNNMSKSLQQTIDFLEKKVLKDYDNFMNVSDQYNNDAKGLNDTMESIHDAVDHMNSTMLSITDSIAEINTMIGEASEGVVDVTEKNTNIVALTTDTYHMVKESNDYAEKLQNIVDKFKL